LVEGAVSVHNAPVEGDGCKRDGCRWSIKITADIGRAGAGTGCGNKRAIGNMQAIGWAQECLEHSTQSVIGMGQLRATRGPDKRQTPPAGMLGHGCHVICLLRLCLPSRYNNSTCISATTPSELRVLMKTLAIAAANNDGRLITGAAAVSRNTIIINAAAWLFANVCTVAGKMAVLNDDTGAA